MAGREAAATEARGGARPARRPAARGADTAEERYDLLTAALLGVAVGVTATMLLRSGRSSSRVVRPLALAREGRDVLEAGLERAGKKASKLMGRGTTAISETAEELGRYLGSAREAIDDVVAEELRDLRRAIRRQRRRAGL